MSTSTAIQIPALLIEKVQDIGSKKIKDVNFSDLIGKRNWKYMTEINFAPKRPVSESEIKNTIVRVTWPDGGQNFYWMDDLIRMELFKITTTATLSSHGMENFEFVKWWIEKYPQASNTTEMAVYFYRKIL